MILKFCLDQTKVLKMCPGILETYNVSDLGALMRKRFLLSTTMSTSTRFGIGSRLGPRTQRGTEVAVPIHDDAVHTLREV